MIRPRGLHRRPVQAEQLDDWSVVLRVIINPENPGTGNEISVSLQPVNDRTLRRLANRGANRLVCV